MLAQQNNDTQLLEQMRKINERLYMLDRKMDVLADLLKAKNPENKSTPKASKPLNPIDFYAQESNQHQHHHNNRPKERMMYAAVCADCQKECSIPFKPTGERPVYCKECFSRRKSPNSFKSKEKENPQAVAQVQPAVVLVQEEVKTTKVKKTKVAAKTKKKTGAAKKFSPKKAAAKKPRRK